MANAAELYDQNSSGQREHGLNLLKLISLEKGSKVLDFGCGTGYLTKVIADLLGPEGKVNQYSKKVYHLSRICRNRKGMLC